jgi:hypothetical protein
LSGQYVGANCIGGEQCARNSNTPGRVKAAPTIVAHCYASPVQHLRTPCSPWLLDAATGQRVHPYTLLMVDATMSSQLALAVLNCIASRPVFLEVAAWTAHRRMHIDSVPTLIKTSRRILADRIAQYRLAPSASHSTATATANHFIPLIAYAAASTARL